MRHTAKRRCTFRRPRRLGHWHRKAELSGKLDLAARNVCVVPIKGDPRSLWDLPQAELDRIRAALYLFTDGSWVIENFRTAAVVVEIDGTRRAVAPRGWPFTWKLSTTIGHNMPSH